MHYFIKRPHIKINMAGIRIIVCNIFKTNFALLYLFGKKRQIKAKIIRNNITNISRIEALSPKNIIVIKYELNKRINNTVSVLNKTFSVIGKYLFIERIITKNEQ